VEDDPVTVHAAEPRQGLRDRKPSAPNSWSFLPWTS
jgi:hypothetical protein